MVGLFFHRKSKRDPEPTGPLPDFEATAPALYDPRLADYEDTTPDALPGMPDLYAILGVDSRASDDAIRYAYRHRAARLLDARWRPGRAARRLAQLNAAYEILGKPDRRADYDRQRMREAAYERARLAASRAESFQTASYSPVESVSEAPAADVEPNTTFSAGVAPAAARFADGAFHDGPTRVGIDGAATAARPAQPLPVQPIQPARRRGLLLRRPNNRREALLLLIAAVLALVVVAGLVRAAWPVDDSSLARTGRGIGFNPPWAAPTATALPAPTPRPVLVRQPIAPTPTSAWPTATLPAKPMAATELGRAPAAGAGAVDTQIQITDPNPPRRSDVGVTVRVARDDRPLRDVPVALRVYYRTIEERWPPGEETVTTDASGEASIVFNIGDATPGYEAQVVAVVDVDGEPFEMQTSFVPR